MPYFEQKSQFVNTNIKKDMPNGFQNKRLHLANINYQTPDRLNEEKIYIITKPCKVV